MAAVKREFQIVITTCPDVQSAERLAEKLVGEGLAACVNIVPVAQSIYRWRGQVERSAEHLLLIKGRMAFYKTIERLIMSLHPYELPEIITVPISGGSSAYLKWLHNPD